MPLLLGVHCCEMEQPSIGSPDELQNTRPSMRRAFVSAIDGVSLPLNKFVETTPIWYS